jgi:GNAT superfamily N-acetyltransferase
MDGVSPHLRPARPDDLNFLVWIDIRDEGVSSAYMANWDDAAWARHRAAIGDFIDAPAKIAIVAEAEAGRRVGAAYARLRNRLTEGDDPGSISLCLDRSLFPADGRFCEMFQLWVDPDFRRAGLASRLKLAVEAAARERGVTLICTATEAANAGAVALNEKLGYRAARVGPVWDAIPRVSFIKHL